jgi:L,D-transpeptidase ErfK/SrfK
MANDKVSRRAVLGGAVGVAGLAALPALAQDGSTEFIQPATSVRNNVSSFRMLQWQDYFDNTRNGAILADTTSRALHFWSDDQSIYRLYPTSVPLTEELTRRGVTSVVQKVVNPTWRPTVRDERARHPDWPDLSSRAERQGQPARHPRALPRRGPYYRDPRHARHPQDRAPLVERAASAFTTNMFEELFEIAKVGTQVRLI